MKQPKHDLKKFKAFAMSRESQRKTRGGHVNIPGGTGSTGLIDWGEIDVRANNFRKNVWKGGLKLRQWVFGG